MKDIYCSYYTNSDAITSYMVGRLGAQDGNVILEPSAGEGIFINALIKENKNLTIDAVDMDSNAVSVLIDKYKGIDKISIRETDTLFDEMFDKMVENGGYYDRVIGNPPYGAWQDYEKRDALKDKYKGQYVKETYSLFLLRGISLLKTGGILSFIIPDTYLFLNMHKRLREYMLRYTEIHEILIFPSKFFPGVRFGYSNLSIITLSKKSKPESGNHMRIIKGLKRVEELPDILDNKIKKHCKVFIKSQSDILHTPDFSFMLADKAVSAIFEQNKVRLGDVAYVVTGFYCGNNKKFIKVKDTMVKGGKGYEVIGNDVIGESQSLAGISDLKRIYIPYIKSSSQTKYIRKDNNWFINWGCEAVEFYNTDRKARFQNSQFYFKTGVALPMVKSKIINATLMKQSLFDQSVVGIFPKEDKYLYYILAFINTDIACELIHVLNPTANNSSSYVKKIPFIVPSEMELAFITSLVKKLIMKIGDEVHYEANELREEINGFFNNLYQ